MKESVAIQVLNVTKKYRIGLRESVGNSFSERIYELLLYPFKQLKRLNNLSSFKKEGEDIVNALEGVSFEVKKGEVLGIVGKNGAGKSTLLKVLSKVTYPTKGEYKIHGRVASLLEVGTGFHPELTGRENVFLNGTILGMKKKEIRDKFDEIVSFSGVEKFIDTPVKRYSSGMQVRLAFAVAAHLDPEILIIDEVLAVGDSEFQKKCLGKMNDISSEGRTVLFVSHNMGSVMDLCNRAILLEKGKVVFEGTPQDVVNKYLGPGGKSKNPIVLEKDSKSQPFIIDKVTLLDENNCLCTEFDIASKVKLKIELEVFSFLEEFRLNLILYKNHEMLFHSRISDDHDLVSFQKGKYGFEYELPALSLIADTYYVTIIGAYMGGNSGPLFKQNIENIALSIDENKTNTEYLGYAKKRGGKIISPGKWNI